jgi:hypothetical protein
MMPMIRQGDYVAWKWLSGYGHGIITSVIGRRAEIESNGAQIVRNGTQDDPALIISDHSGKQVLKRAHEVKITRKDTR